MTHKVITYLVLLAGCWLVVLWLDVACQEHYGMSLGTLAVSLWAFVWPWVVTLLLLGLCWLVGGVPVRGWAFLEWDGEWFIRVLAGAGMIACVLFAFGWVLMMVRCWL